MQQISKEPKDVHCGLAGHVLLAFEIWFFGVYVQAPKR